MDRKGMITDFRHGVLFLSVIRIQPPLRRVGNTLRCHRRKAETDQRKVVGQAVRKRKLKIFMDELKSTEQLIDFDEQLFIRTVGQITVFPDKLVFVFKNGTEIPVEE